MRNAKVYPRAGIVSTHNPLINCYSCWYLGKLKDKDSYSSLEFKRGIDLVLEKLIDNSEVTWTYFKDTVTSVANIDSRP